jgi:pimeloyl-ACP methyl ester carboxylesterase
MERVSALDGIEVRARLQGHRTPIVFVHGAMDRSSAFLRTSRLLSAYPVVIYDRRGYGRSALREGEPTPDISGQVTDLHAIIEFCTLATGQAPIVVGHSLGGTIAILAAGERPTSISGLVIYESPLLWESWWPPQQDQSAAAGEPSGDERTDGARMAESFLRRMIGDARWESLPEQTRIRRREEGRTLRSELLSGRAIEAPNLAAITVPVIVGVGSGADALRQRAASTLVASLSEASSVVLADAPHNLHTADPARFSALVELLDPLVGPEMPTIA